MSTSVSQSLLLPKLVLSCRPSSVVVLRHTSGTSQGRSSEKGFVPFCFSETYSVPRKRQNTTPLSVLLFLHDLVHQYESTWLFDKELQRYLRLRLRKRLQRKSVSGVIRNVGLLYTFTYLQRFLKSRAPLIPYVTLLRVSRPNQDWKNTKGSWMLDPWVVAPSMSGPPYPDGMRRRHDSRLTCGWSRSNGMKIQDRLP